jgi:crotonobetainyl-CoA:carnitine CoA-transferase CaiB-like acyl-CoA transferase
MGRAGFGSAELRARHPRLITVDISGYGEEGEYASMKAYDLLVQAESGLAAVTGRAEGRGASASPSATSPAAPWRTPPCWRR